MTEPKRKSSGEHPAVTAYRNKLDSIGEHTVPQLQALNERIDRLKNRSEPPKRDPRREESDPRADDEPPVDVVELDDAPTDPDLPRIPPAAKKE